MVFNDNKPKHEVVCPSCDATIRARMADAPEPSSSELRGMIEGLEGSVAMLCGVVEKLAYSIGVHIQSGHGMPPGKD